MFRAVDPDSMNSDPYTDLDHAFQVNPDTDPIRIQGFDDQKLKNTAEIFFISFFDQKLQFTYVQATGEKPSALKREYRALQKMKFINFFLCLWVSFALLDPDPDCESRY